VAGVCIAVEDAHRRTVLDEDLRDAATDAISSAGDESHSPVDIAGTYAPRGAHVVRDR
jgi:hypothetical protein